MKGSWKALVVLAGIMLVAPVTVLNGQAAPPEPGLQSAAQRPPGNVPGTAARQRLQREVRHELVMLPFFGVFDHLAYKIDGYTVTLLGHVTRPTLKTDAGRAVRRIEGVENVINEIEVLPLSPHDDRLRLLLYRSIYGHAALNRYAIRAVAPIQIVVKNGNVTLEGVAATEADKNIAGIQANSVSGVFSVSNNLQVEKE